MSWVGGERYEVIKEGFTEDVTPEQQEAVGAGVSGSRNSMCKSPCHPHQGPAETGRSAANDDTEKADTDSVELGVEMRGTHHTSCALQSWWSW